MLFIQWDSFTGVFNYFRNRNSASCAMLLEILILFVLQGCKSGQYVTGQKRTSKTGGFWYLHADGRSMWRPHFILWKREFTELSFKYSVFLDRMDSFGRTRQLVHPIIFHRKSYSLKGVKVYTARNATGGRLAYFCMKCLSEICRFTPTR